MSVEILSQKPCETILSIDGYKLRLWAIFTGVLALAFEDNYGITERYNYVERHDSRKVKSENSCLAQAVPMPSPDYNELPNGEVTLRNFVEMNLPLVFSRETRLEQVKKIFPALKIESKRFWDKTERSYFRCELKLKRFSPVTVSSKYAAGRCENMIDAGANRDWLKLRDTFNPLFDNGYPNWADLSNEDFEKVLKVLEEIK